MIDFDDEVMKFQPSLEVGEVEGHIVDSDMTDVSDIILNILKSVQTAAPAPSMWENSPEYSTPVL